MPGSDSSIFRKYEFCRDLPNAVLDDMASRFELVSYPAESALLGEEDRGKCIFLIESGSVRIKYDDRPLEDSPALIADSGDIFGEIALLSDCRMQEIATVREDCRLFRLAKSDLFNLLGSYPEIRAVLSRFTLKKFAFEPSLVFPGTGEKKNTELEITGKLSDMFFKARLVGRNRFLALRMIPYELAFDEKFRTRFEASREQILRLKHPNIARTLRLVDAYHTHFSVCEFFDGESLKTMLSRRRPDVPECLSIIKQAAAALDYAHRKKILHRNLSPGKIIVSNSGKVQLVDFGIGRYEFFNQDGQTIVREGAPQYMSPEQIKDEEIDSRSDIYSFGVICYRLLANRLPFVGKNPTQTALMRMEAVPTDICTINPAVPHELGELVTGMLEKEREKRLNDLGLIQKVNLRRAQRSRATHTLSTRKATAYSISSAGRFEEISNRRKLITLIVGLFCVIVLIVFRFAPERAAQKNDPAVDLFSAMEKNLYDDNGPAAKPAAVNEQENEKYLLQGQIFFLQKDYGRAISEWEKVENASSYYRESRANIGKARMLATQAVERGEVTK